MLRFYNGPIDNGRDGPETLLNAWPVDEAYIDVVRGNDRGGLVQDVERYPSLNATVLQLANERGGEANICVGWHALEFMLWGQDFFPDGPGRRSPNDFVDGQSPHAARRREYVLVIADLLVAHLQQLEHAWADDADNYRRKFVANPTDSIRRMLTGMVVLSGFELGGERMAVAYETKDQEDEHSCFSDATRADFLANQRGIVQVFRGTGPGMDGFGLRNFAKIDNPKLTAAVDAALDQTSKALAAIPQPFDQAMRGSDDEPGRKAIATAMDLLADQADLLAALALSLGYEIPIRPSGQ